MLSPAQKSSSSAVVLRQATDLKFLDARLHPNRGGHGLADFGRRVAHANSRLFHGLDLLRRRAMPAGNNRSGMAHAASWGGGLSGNESDHWLFHSRLHEFRRSLLGVAADFADHHHRLGLRIAIEEIQGVDKIRPDDRVAADANGRRLPDATGSELMHGFVRQRARARNDA